MAFACEATRMSFRLAKQLCGQGTGYTDLKREEVEEEKGSHPFYAVALISYHAFCACTVTFAILNGWLERCGGGLALELWALWQQLCLWNLFLQNLHRCVTQDPWLQPTSFVILSYLFMCCPHHVKQTASGCPINVYVFAHSPGLTWKWNTPFWKTRGFHSTSPWRSSRDCIVFMFSSRPQDSESLKMCAAQAVILYTLPPFSDVADVIMGWVLIGICVLHASWWLNNNFFFKQAQFS